VIGLSFASWRKSMMAETMSVTSRMSLRSVMQETHPVQIVIVIGVLLFDVVALAVTNRLKHREAKSTHCAITWRSRRNAYWAFITLSISASLLLDVYFDISPVLVPVKAYAFAFPLGLLDLYFSQTSGVPMVVLIGATLWCSTVYLRQVLVDIYTGGHGVNTLRVVRIVGPSSIATEMLRYVLCLPVFGMLSDFFFSQCIGWHTTQACTRSTTRSIMNIPTNSPVWCFTMGHFLMTF